jgi:hypothetical protein
MLKMLEAWALTRRAKSRIIIISNLDISLVLSLRASWLPVLLH